MISSISSTISPRDLTLHILLSLFYFEAGQSASLRPFQFQCYDNDICTWPQQYCSSKAYEQRCIPCLRSVCSLQSPPLQCLYNCSLIGYNIDTIVFVVVGLCVAFSIPVAYLVAKISKLKKVNVFKVIINFLQDDEKRRDAKFHHMCRAEEGSIRQEEK
ncbi:uncharacterized protein LOC128545911 isoform X3 [Mercenaria mercenaria]|uniref:uncharacterized protein LOC128545911 isoform X3 n=1 Tax=Mercenaria mercenaria TaxID=6596 RepID=UPI00234F8E9A|nr:uncharacterized protein LOC128545911 isoform X3 [Mercenaria mercenaria]